MEPGFVYYHFWNFEGHIGNVESGNRILNLQGVDAGPVLLLALELGLLAACLPVG
jgi:hypothetical protein